MLITACFVYKYIFILICFGFQCICCSQSAFPVKTCFTESFSQSALILLLLEFRSSVNCDSYMRPFTAVEGSGFMKFCHTLVNIQNKYASPIDISNNLPGREAFRSGVKRRASSVRDQITEQIKLVYNRDRTLNFTTDLWTCDYTKNSYIDISWHYLESKEEMSTFAIGTIPFGYESHTAINIESKIKEVFEQYGISSELLFQSSFSTSDCARNISLALYNISYPTQCANHRLSTSLQTAWDRTTLKCLEARNLMDDCTELVRFMKQSALYYQKMTKKYSRFHCSY